MLSEESTSTAMVFAPGANRVTSSTGSAISVSTTAMAAICRRWMATRRRMEKRAVRRPRAMPIATSTAAAVHQSTPKSPANVSSPCANASRGYLNSHSNHIERR